MTGRPLRVAVLCGGPSREHAVSLRSGSAVAEALASVGHRVLPVRIDREGRWALTASAQDLLVEPGPETGSALPAATALSRLGEQAAEDAVDVVFVALHGPYGEDGTVQGFLETAGVAYTGSGPAASALAMDKERTKEVLAHHGFRTPAWVGVERRRYEAAPDAVRAALLTEPGLPLVVKPVRDGSSFGVTLVREGAALGSALAAGLEGTDGRALVECMVEGTEISCPVVGSRGEAARAFPVVEIVPLDRPFFDFEAKYEGASEEICPARIPQEVGEEVRDLAVRAHEILGCDGLSRSDFILDAGGAVWFLETNTVPGMTPPSLSPLSAAAAGVPFPELCDLLVRMAVQGRSGSRPR